jgi:hypothetical protein
MNARNDGIAGSHVDGPQDAHFQVRSRIVHGVTFFDTLFVLVRPGFKPGCLLTVEVWQGRQAWTHLNFVLSLYWEKGRRGECRGNAAKGVGVRAGGKSTTTGDGRIVYPINA